MEDLKLEDLEGIVVKVTPAEFLGKKAYIRNLTFDGQILVHERFGKRMEDDATPDDMRALIALVLCDKAGNLLFKDHEHGMEVLTRLDGDEMQDIFSQAKLANGWDVEQEAKNLKAVRQNT